MELSFRQHWHLHSTPDWHPTDPQAQLQSITAWAKTLKGLEDTPTGQLPGRQDSKGQWDQGKEAKIGVECLAA